MKSADNPLVTVYMPTYNRASLLSRAIESVLSQTYSNFELIIVDDGSTDNTHDLLAAYAKQDNRITYYINEHNQGACVSRNKAIKKAQGKFITGLDDDDYFLPNRLESFVTAWSVREKDVILLFSRYGNLNKDSSVSFSKPIFGCRGNIITQGSLIENFYTGNQIFTTTSALKSIGMFDENMPMWQDFDCYYRLLSLGLGQRVNKFTYIVDSSHTTTRISNGCDREVLKVFSYFKRKHAIESLSSCWLLESHMYNYDKSLVRVRPSIYKFLINPSRKSLKNLGYGLKFFFNKS